MGLDVAATLRTTRRRRPATAAATTAEHLAEEIAEAVAADVEVVLPRASGAAHTGRSRTETADLVVLLALGLIAEHVVRGADLLEALLGRGITRVRVGVAVASELAVRLGDLLGARAVAHTEHLVVVLLEPLTLGCHRHTPPFTSSGDPAGTAQPRTFTMAGRRTLPFQV